MTSRFFNSFCVDGPYRTRLWRSRIGKWPSALFFTHNDSLEIWDSALDGTEGPDEIRDAREGYTGAERRLLGRPWIDHVNSSTNTGLLCCCLDTSQHGIESVTVEIAAVHDDRPNLLRIRNVVERISIEQHQVCELSSFYPDNERDSKWLIAAPPSD